MSGKVDVLLRLSVLRHTLPILVADANHLHGGKLDATKTAAELREVENIFAELIAADREYDAAVKLAGRVITNDVQRKVSDALARRAAALARIKD